MNVLNVENINHTSLLIYYKNNNFISKLFL